VLAQAKKKFEDRMSVEKKNDWVWWHMPVIPTTMAGSIK
jgi:hypothetical protein